MERYNYEGKNIDEVKMKALESLNKTEDEVFINVLEDEGGLFKSKRVKIEVVVKEEILNYLKDILGDIVDKMGIKANIETKIRDNNFKLTLFSNNNAILDRKSVV